jgi:hypothetical protein
MGIRTMKSINNRLAKNKISHREVVVPTKVIKHLAPVREASGPVPVMRER